MLKLIAIFVMHFGAPFVDFAEMHKIYESKTAKEIVDLYKTNLSPMLRKINDEIEPCDNFFKHVCGDRDSDDAFDQSEAPPPFLYNVEDQMHFFEHQRGNFTTAAGMVLARMYDECKNRETYHVFKTKPTVERWEQMICEIEFFKNHKTLYRRWPFLRFQWEQYVNRRYDLNWIKLAAELAAHGIQIFLNIFFAENTIFIEPFSQSFNCSGIEEGLLPVLRRRNPQIATIIGAELQLFCEQLNDLNESGSVRNNNSTDSPNIDGGLLENITSTYFNVFFSTLNLTESEVEKARHITLDLPQLERVLQLLNETDERIIYNFILWHAYQRLAYKDCFQLTSEWPEFLLSEYWSWAAFKPFMQRDVALVLYVLQTTRFQRHRKTLHLQNDWERRFPGKVEGPDFIVERLMKKHATAYLNDDFLIGDLDLNDAMQENNFYANLLQLQRAKLRRTFFRTLPDFDDMSRGFYYLREFINFSILILKRPLFHYFVTQDFDLWHSSHLLESTDGYYTSLDCLEHQTLVNRLDGSEEEEEGDAQPQLFTFLNPWQTLELFNFYNAFIASYDDYRFWLSTESFAFAEEFVLKYFQLDSQKILFYAAAQLYCGRNDPLFSVMINRSFMNMLEFHTAFNCSAEAPMNPAEKCMQRSCIDDQ